MQQPKIQLYLRACSKQRPDLRGNFGPMGCGPSSGAGLDAEAAADELVQPITPAVLDSFDGPLSQQQLKDRVQGASALKRMGTGDAGSPDSRV